MDLNKLKVFHAVAKFGGVTLASADLKMRSSSISTSISLFEKEVGCKLFQRHYRGMKLTPEGEKLYKSSKLIFDEFEFALKDLSEKNKDVISELKISTSWGIASSNWFVDKMSLFLEGNPNIKIKLLDYSKNNIEDTDADIFICPYIYDQLDLIQLKTKTFCFRMFASKEYVAKYGLPESVDDLDNHRLIAFTQELMNPFNSVDSILHIGRESQNPRIVDIEVNSSVCLLKLIKRGVGIGVISIEAEIDSNLIPILEENEFLNSIYIVYKKKNRNLSVIRTFVEFKKET